jgi:AraC-like DNA-binding protein
MAVPGRVAGSGSTRYRWGAVGRISTDADTLDGLGDAPAPRPVGSPPRPEVVGLSRDDLVLERYRYPPGRKVVMPTHSHDEYQVNLNLDLPGGYRYRGEQWFAPAGRLAVIMPGEPHSPRDPDDRAAPSRHLTLYIRADELRSVAEAVAERPTATPFFPDPIVEDLRLVGRFVRLHAALAEPGGRLEHDVRVVDFLGDLVARHADTSAARAPRSAHRSVRQAQDYLRRNYAANVSLAELSEVAELSAYRLTRLFTSSVGMPPHAYQIQLRIEHAKKLLLAGSPVSVAGHAVGFFDLSHFTRHFKRHLGVPPGGYATGWSG